MILIPFTLSAYPYELMFKLHYSQFKKYDRSTSGITTPKRTQVFEDIYNEKRRLDKELVRLRRKYKEYQDISLNQKYIAVLLDKIEKRLGSWITEVD